jgi:hypothetical protein
MVREKGEPLEGRPTLCLGMHMSVKTLSALLLPFCLAHIFPTTSSAQQRAFFTINGTESRQAVVGVGGSLTGALPGGIDSLLAQSGWETEEISGAKERIAALIFDELDPAAIGLDFPLEHEYEHLDEMRRNESPSDEGTIPDGNISFLLRGDKVLLSPLPLPHTTYIVTDPQSPSVTELSLETLNDDWTGEIQLALYHGLFSNYEFEETDTIKLWGDLVSGTHQRVAHSYETAAQHYWPFMATARTERFTSLRGTHWYTLPLAVPLVPELESPSWRSDAQAISYVGIRWYPSRGGGDEIPPEVRARWLSPPLNGNPWELRKPGTYPSYTLPAAGLEVDSFPQTAWDTLTFTPTNLHEDRYLRKGNVKMLWTGWKTGNDNADPEELDLAKFKVTGEEGETWDTDVHRWICEEAQKEGRRGNDIYFKMRVNSPAAWLKTHDSTTSSFIKPGFAGEFREHLVGHMKAWYEATGISFDGVEIDNEPENGVWYPCSIFPLCPPPSPNPLGFPGGPTFYREFAVELMSGLEDIYGIGQTPKVHMGCCVLPDRTTTFLLGGYCLSPLYHEMYFEGALVGGMPSDNWLIDSHVYTKWSYEDYTDPLALVYLYGEFLKMQRAFNDSGFGDVPIAISEFCLSRSAPPDPDHLPDGYFKIAVFTAARVACAFAYEAPADPEVISRVSQVHWWLLCSSSGKTRWGEMLIDVNGGRLEILPQFYGIKHFSHFLHGDCYRVLASADSSSAEVENTFAITAFKKGGSEPSVMIVIMAGAPRWYTEEREVVITVDCPGLPPDLSFAAYRSIDVPGSVDDLFWTDDQIPDSLTAEGTCLSDTISSHSITTYIAALPPGS